MWVLQRILMTDNQLEWIVQEKSHLEVLHGPAAFELQIRMPPSQGF